MKLKNLLVGVVGIITLVAPLFFASSVLASGDTVNVPVDNNPWTQNIFGGDSIVLDILKPLNLWGGGTATILSFVGMIIANGFILLFIVAIGAAAVGALKMSSSGGNDQALESGKKWATNGVTGVIVVIVVFAVTNVATIIFGFGSVFELAQNFSECGGVMYYEWKKTSGAAGTCVGSSWVVK